MDRYLSHTLFLVSVRPYTVTIGLNRMNNIAHYRVIVCTDFSGKKPEGQVGVGSMLTSGNIGDVMVRTLSKNARNSG